MEGQDLDSKLKDWAKTNSLGDAVLESLVGNGISTLDDFGDLTNKEEVDEFVNELGLKILMRKKLTKAILSLINSSKTQDGDSTKVAPNNGASAESGKSGKSGASGDNVDDEKKVEIERMKFPDGINVVPFTKREYRLPDLETKDYSFRGGKGFAGATVQVLATICNGVKNLTNGKNFMDNDESKEQVNKHDKPEKLFSSDKHKIILVCGKTGAGKSTLINSMMNYIYNVGYNDKFRLKLIEENKKEKGNADSSTDHISSYTIKKPKGGNIDYDLTIVDTPGFGDVRGLQKDMQILEEFKYIFECVLTSVDGICFVVKSADNRLDGSQTYVFNNILNLWAKELIDNIFILMTFADGQKCNCIDALDANETLKKVKRRFKINNSAFYVDPTLKHDSSDPFDALFWDMGMKCFEQFFNELNSVKSQPIEKSKQVLRKRDYILTQIHHISKSLDETLVGQQQVNEQKKYVKRHEKEINDGKEIFIPRKKMKWEKFPTSNKWVTTCRIHLRSCHPNCGVENKRHCCMINEDGYCTAGECTCHVDDHFNADYEYRQVWIDYTESSWKKDPTKREEYNQHVRDKNRAANEIAKLEKELKRLEMDAQQKVAAVQNLRNELETIALRPVLSTAADYIEQLIQNEEESETRDKDKIQLLKELKQKESIAAKIQQKRNDLKPSDFKHT